MITIKNPKLAAVIIVGAVCLMLLAPLIVFFAINVIFPTAQIEYNFQNYVLFQLARLALSTKITV